MLSPRRLAAVCGTVVLAGWVAVGLARFAASGINIVAPTEETRATSVAGAAERVEAPRVATIREDGLSRGNAAMVDAVLPRPIPPPGTPVRTPETPLVQVAVVVSPDSGQKQPNDSVNPVEPLDSCSMVEACIDQYLWSLYQRAAKVDTITVRDQVKVTIKKKGKTRTVVKTVKKLVDEDFTWKDPKAANKAGMPLMDYVIGGMERSFKLKLYHALRALDDIGLSPGITSGFRDDYRQSLASGLKAASDSSYHGGSRRGGYGHGLAADVVSVKGATRSERWSATETLWKWIDVHGGEFGIGRPYLDRDPAHFAPTDGKEYADHRARANAQRAGLETNKRHPAVAHDHRKMTKRAGTARPSRAKSI